jgi:hypothetical protein
MTHEERWLQQQLDNPDTLINIVSGEGDGVGTIEEFGGRRTIRALLAAVKRETCNGDRWAYALINTPDGHAYKLYGQLSIEQID